MRQEQLTLLFDEAAGLAIPAMPKPSPALKAAPNASTGAKPSAKNAKPAKPPLPTAAQSLAEAERLIFEGLRIRHASLQRRFKLRGPVTFDSPAPQLPTLKSFKELVPEFLKAAPAGWEVQEQEFVRAMERPDAAAIAKLINARRDELGVYRCERTSQGWRMVVEF